MIRDLWLSRFCVGWEMPACFYPRVQLEEPRDLGASSENPCCLCLLKVWNAQFSIPVLAY